MCTSIIEIARAEGMAKRGDQWFPLSRSVVAYDHARHAPLGDVITLDFFNTDLDAGARAGIELTLETAKELRAALDRAIAAAEFEEAEVRGKGVRAQPRSSCVTNCGHFGRQGNRVNVQPSERSDSPQERTPTEDERGPRTSTENGLNAPYISDPSMAPGHSPIAPLRAGVRQAFGWAKEPRSIHARKVMPSQPDAYGYGSIGGFSQVGHQQAGAQQVLGIQDQTQRDRKDCGAQYRPFFRNVRLSAEGHFGFWGTLLDFQHHL